MFAATGMLIFATGFQCGGGREPLHGVGIAPVPGTVTDGGRPSAWNSLGPNPCEAKNPIGLVGPVALSELDAADFGTPDHCSDGHGHDGDANRHCHTDAGADPYTFTLAAAANVCLQVQSTDSAQQALHIEGLLDHGPTANWDVTLSTPDGGAACGCQGLHGHSPHHVNGPGGHGWGHPGHPGHPSQPGHPGSPTLPQRDCTDVTVGVPFTLPAGTYKVKVRHVDHPSDASKVAVSVFGQGPYIDSFTPVIAHSGEPIALTGEGFQPSPTVEVGGVSYPVMSVNAAGTQFEATVPPQSPIGPMTVTTPLGSGTSAAVFTPADTHGLVHLYPFASFDVDDSGSCVAPKNLQIVQDGAQLSIAVTTYRPLPADAKLSIDMETDGNFSQPDHQFVLQNGTSGVSVVGPTGALGAMDQTHTVATASFKDLGLLDPVTLGRFWTRIQLTASCGSASYPDPAGPHDGYADIRSAFAPGIFVVQTTDPAGVTAAEGMTQLSQDDGSHIVAMGYTDDRGYAQALVELLEDDNVTAAIPDPIFYPTEGNDTECGDDINSTTFDTGTSDIPAPKGQWYLNTIDIPIPVAANAGAGITVAVFGSGVDEIPELSGSLVPGFNTLITATDNETTDQDSEEGHDTMVASLIAAHQGNGGIVGVAPGAKIMPVRTLFCPFGGNCLGEGTSTMQAFDRIDAMHSTMPSLQVINISNAEFTDLILELGQAGTTLVGTGFPFLGPGDVLGALASKLAGPGVLLGKLMQSTETNVINDGIAVVASSGDSRDDPWGFLGPQYPANNDDAIAVGGVDDQGNIDPQSTAGSTIKIAAPSVAKTGEGLRGSQNLAQVAAGGNGFQCLAGTSFSAPLVAGAIANVMSPNGSPSVFHTGMSAAQLLEQTARQINDTDPNDVGHGEVDLGAANTLVQNQLIIQYDDVTDLLADVDFDSTNRIWALFNNGLDIGLLTDDTFNGDVGVEAILPTPVGIGGWIHAQTPVAGTTATRVAVGRAGSNVVELLSVDPNNPNSPVISSNLLQLSSPSTGRGVILFVESDHSYLAVPMANNDISLIDMSSGALIPAVIHTNGPIVGLANAGQVGSGMLAAFGPRSGVQGVDLFNWSFDASGPGFSATPRLSTVTFGTASGAVTDAVFGASDTSGNPALFLTETSPGELVRVSSTDGSVTTPFTDADSPGLGALDLNSIVYSIEKNKLIVADRPGNIFLLDGATAGLLNSTVDPLTTATLRPMHISADGSLAVAPDLGSIVGEPGHPPTSNGIVLVSGF